MRYFIIFLLLANPLFAQHPSIPEIPFHSVPDFLKLPSDLYLGEAAGVAVNSKGHVFVFSRGNTSGPAYAARAAQLLEFGADGKFLREIGHNLYAWSYAHTVKVDKDDNIWVTDKGSDMRARQSATSRHRQQAQCHPARRGQSVSHLRLIKSCTAPMPSRVAYTSSAWTEKFWECSASPANSSINSAGFMKLRVHQKTSSTSVRY